MKRKIIIAALAVIAATACISGLAACQKDNHEPQPDPSHTHEYGEWEVVTEATCTKAGEKAKKCACGDTVKEEIPALGHDLEHFDYKAPSCKETGWEAYDACKRDGCGYTTFKKLDKTAHTFSADYENNNKCKVCGYEKIVYTPSDDGDSYVFSQLNDLSITELTIPSTVNGKPVTAVGGFAFHETKVKKVVIPNSVTVIAAVAFSECEDLETVVIPDSVEYIGGGAFGDCPKLKTINIPDGVTSIGYNAFDGCDSLEYNVRGGVNYLGNENNPYLVYVRAENTEASTVEIPADTKIIYSSAFSGYENLETVVIPDSIIDIGGEVFADCVNLKNVTLPQGLKEIGIALFRNCTSLSEIQIPESVTVIGGGAFQGCTSLENIQIPANVTEISGEAFWESGIKKVDFLGNGVTEIGTYAFKACQNLESFVFPESVKLIGDYVFAECLNLEWVYIPATAESIGFYIFEFCEGHDIRIYFNGTADEWKAVNIIDRSSYPTANIYYYSATKPEGKGNYWHWDLDGEGESVPAVWTK